ncbi:hypothetical protein N7333_12335 [Pseudomonas sp. GD04158]|uniref:hypothetical protein n=1 Tax=Pseudomonas sp. GD04158 TaxID=2975439 RepID=UPI0024485868|nr:hypothetical protein [Pseudomonas sp. GD04158]MDH0097364.1 hypothetical protein [Pseudomonas sp. GD04158]
MAHELTTEQVLSDSIKAVAVKSENVRAVQRDRELYLALLGIFNSTLKMAPDDTLKFAFAASNKAVTTGKLAGKATDSTSVIIGLSAAQLLIVTANLITQVGKGPGSAATAIGAAFAKKTAIAFGMIGKDDKQAKCIAALSDLAASGLSAALVVPTAATGIGSIAMAISLAQIILTALQAYDACIDAKQG